MQRFLYLALWLVLLSFFINKASAKYLGGTDCQPHADELLASGTMLDMRDEFGNPTTNRSEAWGIGYDSCLEACGYGVADFSWPTFSVQFSAWLLPFLALTAQLPYSARGLSMNIMACILAVGSPALITYSLTLTVLYNKMIYRRMQELLDGRGHLPSTFAQKIKYACYFLQQCQHMPIQIIQGRRGWLSSAIVIPKNTIWWRKIEKSLRSRARPWTASLVLQMAWAVVASVFTIISSFGMVGDTTTGLGLSSGAVWFWLFPVVLGWVFVGTQSNQDSLKQALEDGNERFCLSTSDSKLRTFDHGENQPMETAIIQRSRPLMSELRSGRYRRRVITSYRPSTLDGSRANGQGGSAEYGREYAPSNMDLSSMGSPNSIEISRGVGAPPPQLVISGEDEDLETAVIFEESDPQNSTQGIPMTSLDANRARHGRSSSASTTGSDSLGIRMNLRSQEQALMADEPNPRPSTSQRRSSDIAGDDPAASRLILSEIDSTGATFLGFRVHGDEEEPGPLYSYARINTARRAAEHILYAFKSAKDQMVGLDATRVDGRPWIPLHTPGSEANFTGSSQQMANYCGLHLGETLDIYPEHSPEESIAHRFVASVLAMVVLWGTAGSGLLIAYQTPVVGLGCYSGSILIYAVTATISWLLLVLAASASERWCRLDWNYRIRRQKAPPRWLGRTAVILRLVGKTTAALSAIWLILTNTFSYTNLFSSCWCNSVIITKGRAKAWALVFIDPLHIANVSKPNWAGGLSLSLSVIIIVIAFVMILKKSL